MVLLLFLSYGYQAVMNINNLRNSELSIPPYALFALMAIAYIGGLFVPLMDNDSAHHASIALAMLQDGDWRYLIDHGTPYLDKPHFQFWLVALSFAALGIHAFAYKVSSFIFTILAIWATYSLARYLADKQTAAWAALLLASVAAFALANIDVRMDAILTAAIILAVWQGVLFFDSGNLRNMLLTALALAIAFGTKGWVGVMVPAFALLFYLIGTRQIRRLVNWRFLALIVGFFVFISPILYAYYVQFDLHPEWVIRGTDHHSGVRFILYEQVFERMEGGVGKSSADDPFFFLHTLLWAALPWSLLFYLLLFRRIKRAFANRDFSTVDWLTIPAILLTIAAFSFSQFKLPHYINVVFPLMAVYMAYELKRIHSQLLIKGIGIMQKTLYALLIVAVLLVNCYLFPPLHVWLWVVCIAGAVAVGALLFCCKTASLRNVVVMGCLLSAWLWTMLNFNFYPQLLTYQAGNEMDRFIEAENIPAGDVALYRPYDHSYSFDIAMKRIVPECTLEELASHAAPAKYLFVEQEAYDDLLRNDIPFQVVHQVRDYRITRLTPRFLMPASRNETLSVVSLVRLE